jgi:hypothetical protein
MKPERPVSRAEDELSMPLEVYWNKMLQSADGIGGTEFDQRFF